MCTANAMTSVRVAELEATFAIALCVLVTQIVSTFFPGPFLCALVATAPLLSILCVGTLLSILHEALK